MFLYYKFFITQIYGLERTTADVDVITVFPLLGNPNREDLTFKLWIEAIEEERRKP